MTHTHIVLSTSMGRILRKARINAKLTPSAAVRQIVFFKWNITEKTLRAIEADQKDLSINKARILCRAYSCPLEDIIQFIYR